MGTRSTARAFPGPVEAGLSKRELAFFLLLAQHSRHVPPVYVNVVGSGLPPTGYEDIRAELQQVVNFCLVMTDLGLKALAEAAPAEAPAGPPPWEDDVAAGDDPESGVDLGNCGAGDPS